MSKQLFDLMAEQGRSALDDDSVYNEYLKLSQENKKLADLMAEQGRSALDDDSVYTEYLKFNTPSESPSEMRLRAKSEFASDWLAQKKLEAESIRENPSMSGIAAFFPRLTEEHIRQEQSDPGNALAGFGRKTWEAIKDITSFLGRNVGVLVGGDRENIQKISEEYPLIAKAGGIARGIVEDPLLPMFMGIGAAPMAIGYKMAAGTALPLSDIAIEKGKYGELPNTGDVGISLLQGVLPEAIGLGAAKYGARALRAAENIEPLKKISAYKDFLQNEFGTIAKRESPTIGEVQDILRKGLDEGKIQFNMRKKAEDILNIKDNTGYGGDVAAEFGNMANKKLSNASVGRTTTELGSELIDKIKSVVPDAVPVMAMEAALGRVPLAGAAYGAAKTAIKMEPSLSPIAGKILQGAFPKVSLPAAVKQGTGRLSQSLIGQTLRQPERIDTRSFTDSDARLYNRQMEILRFDPNEPNAKRIAQEIASKYRK